MPLEVRELIIKATVEGDATDDTRETLDESQQDSSYIIQTCVEKVLEILKEKSDR